MKKEIKKEILCMECEGGIEKESLIKILQYDTELNLYVGLCPTCEDKTALAICPLCKKETRLLVMGEVIWGYCDNCKEEIGRKHSDKEVLETSGCWDCADGEFTYVKDLLKEKDYFGFFESEFDGDGLFCESCIIKRLKKKKGEYKTKLKEIDNHLGKIVKE